MICQHQGGVDVGTVQTFAQVLLNRSRAPLNLHELRVTLAFSPCTITSSHLLRAAPHPPNIRMLRRSNILYDSQPLSQFLRAARNFPIEAC